MHGVSKLEVNLQIDETTKGGSVHVSVSKTRKDIEVAVATAYAKALADAKKYHGQKECAAWADAGGCIYTEDHGAQCFECEAVAVSAGSVEKIDAVATASAPLLPYRSLPLVACMHGRHASHSTLSPLLDFAAGRACCWSEHPRHRVWLQLL